MSSIIIKNVLITGAAKRIGREIAIALAKDGWNVAVHHNSTPADDVITEIKKHGVKAVSLKADLNKIDDVKSLVLKAIKELGEITLLINNASIFEKVNFANSSEDVFDRHHNIHVKAPFFLAQEFAKQCSSGQILNIIDTKVTKNKTAYFAYLLSKKSLADLTRMLAVELAPNIRVNAILPGVTELSDDLDQEYLDKRVDVLPMKKKTSLKEIVNAANQLINSTSLTGQFLYLDSGENLI